MDYTHVDKPIRIGSVELKNRVVRPAHGTMYGNRGGTGRMSDVLVAYHEARARGGAALSVIEVGSVHPSSPLSIDLWDETVESGYRKLVERISPHGMKLFQQLWHGGHQAAPRDGSPPWAPSAVPSVEVGIVPIAMTMIDDIVASFGAAARRCEEWGLDGVDLHCAHGYLIGQFLSPNTNVRQDEYGGSYENRTRFLMEIATEVRNAVSPGFAVGIRLAPDLTVNGFNSQDSARLAQILEEKGLIDYVSTSVGNYNTLPKIVGGMHEPLGYELHETLPITHATKLPTVVIGRFRTLEECDQVIRNGDADMVGMVRAMLADPDLVTKSFAGRVDEVRPCIGCNQGCIAQVFSPFGHMECVVNPGVGHELYRGDHILETVDQPRKVLVVGGGPAGLEAARVAAMRGHKVILAEASHQLGGSLRAAAKAPTRYGMIDIVTWLESEIFRLGVNVRLSTYMDEADIQAEASDAVIIATGSTPRMDGIQHSHPGQPIRGIGRRNVLSSEQLLMSPPNYLGETAVVIDDVGHYEAIGCCEHLLNAGLSVTYVTRLKMMGLRIQDSLMIEPFLQRVQDKAFTHIDRHRVVEIEDRALLLSPTAMTGEASKPQRIAADTVVFVSGNQPNRDLYDAMEPYYGANAHVVGDANAPRFLAVAIREGHIAGAAV